MCVASVSQFNQTVCCYKVSLNPHILSIILKYSPDNSRSFSVLKAIVLVGAKKSKMEVVESNKGATAIIVDSYKFVRGKEQKGAHNMALLRRRWRRWPSG